MIVQLKQCVSSVPLRACRAMLSAGGCKKRDAISLAHIGPIARPSLRLFNQHPESGQRAGNGVLYAPEFFIPGAGMPRNITLIKDKILSDNYFILHNITYDLTRSDGEVVRHKREVYDRGNGATILLYNRERQTVVLTRQFRVATWVNGNPDGMLIESCAGLLDADEPEACARKEAIEETGYKVGAVEKLFELYMSPGGVTELIHFFIAEYDDSHLAWQGGGVEDEDIDVLEMPFTDALAKVASGEIRDGKTVILLQQLQLRGVMDQARS